MVSANRGGASDDVFNGTLFDDQSANPIATYLFTNGVAAPDLSPDQSFNSTFAGENPNGSWTLTIADGAGGDVGALSTWSLSVTDGTVIVVPPALGAPSTFSTGPTAISILDYTTSTSPLVVSGATTSIAIVECYVEITHTYASDMLIQVQSPLGTLVDLSNHEGAYFDDVFNGTLFRMNSPNPIGSYAFVDLVAAPDLQPSGDLGAFAGEDANGTWNLVVYDAYGADQGSINRFDVTVTGCGSIAPVSYCTAGTTTNGCNATMSATANPSLTSSVCQITVNDVEGAQSGIMFYGLAQSAVAWGAGSSFLCVKAPLERTGVQVSTGVNGTCGNTMFLDWDAYQLANPSSLGQPFAAGNKVYVQGWFRDPPAPKTTSLSDGLELTYQP
jgi:subtilisin-like proprotein convertase family protein